ncbi:hypothetical protein ACL02T_33025 [Pseudonocardia sp. RS010]|uniref:hypothetical protein n=1 Tax=Pseudonocardia sp. RS010 TaxID=3385979 RepID=UPI0039A3B6A7
MTGQRREVPAALVRFLDNLDNLDDLPVDVLLGTYRELEETRAWARRDIARELNRRGWSWRQIGKALQVDHKTAYGWVHPKDTDGR